MARKFRFRRDIIANWELANPILGDGEPGYEKDTGYMKIGDGVTSWIDLGYFSTGGGSTVIGGGDLEGGSASSIYLSDQSTDGGAANSSY